MNERLKGVSRLGSLDIILDHAHVELPAEEKERLAGRKNEYFGELVRTIKPGDLLPGMEGLLAALRAAGVRTAIASVSHNVFEIVRRLEITNLIDAIVDPATLVKGKPDPEVFFRAAEMLGLPFENCAAVEDAAVGIEAIRAARMFAVGIGPGLPDADWILESTAELEYTSLLERFRSHHARLRNDGLPTAASGEAASAV